VAARPRQKAAVEKKQSEIDPLKEVRGLRQFRLRGQHLVAGEWALACTGHNITKLYRAHGAASAPS